MLKLIVGAVLALLFWKWALLAFVLWVGFKYVTRPRYVVVQQRRRF